MAQHESLVFAHPQFTIFFMAEAVLVILLTFAIVSLVRSSIFQKALFHTSYISSKKADRQNGSSITYSRSDEKQSHFTLPPLKTGASSKMTMGLKRLDKANWLTVDEHYHTEHIIRASHLNQHKSSVLQCLPGSEAGCSEVLDCVATFLSTRYPDSFTIYQSGKEQRIANNLTGENFALGSKNTTPLETAARLAMEDFNLLVKDEGGEYRLQASATLFPAGWRLEERIGNTISDLHGPVPKWKENLERNVNRYFDHLSPTTAMERLPLFVQTVPELFQTSCAAFRSPDEEASTQRPGLTSADIHIRRERQTFSRLPISGAVLFTVHSYITPLHSLSDDEIVAVLETASGWSEDMARYKGREAWFGVLSDYAGERAVGTINKVIR